MSERSTVGIDMAGLTAALEGLDRATRDFARRLAEEPLIASEDHSPVHGSGSEMREAEREALRYLERARHRVDGMIASMLDAADRETAAMRREAEAEIRTRWQQIEFDAQRHVAEARSVAERMVGERQRRIAELSDEITARAQALAASMEDAERVRAQFDSFVRTLAATADQIAAIEPDGNIAVVARSDDGRDARGSSLAA